MVGVVIIEGGGESEVNVFLGVEMDDERRNVDDLFVDMDVMLVDKDMSVVDGFGQVEFVDESLEVVF